MRNDIELLYQDDLPLFKSNTIVIYSAAVVS